MTKIVYNRCYGGFNLSHEAVMRYAEISGITLYYKDVFSGFKTYYRVPIEEFEAINAEEANAPVSPERYARSNAMSFSSSDFSRSDPILVQVVEELGKDANGNCADLQIVELPAGTLYRIDEYDGNESVMTQDDYEWSVA